MAIDAGAESSDKNFVLWDRQARPTILTGISRPSQHWSRVPMQLLGSKPGRIQRMFGVFGGRRKRERASAENLIATLRKGAFGLLVIVGAAYKANRRDEVELNVAKYKNEAQTLLAALDVPRDALFSAGKTGDALNLQVWRQNLAEQGYSSQAAQIVGFIYYHHLEVMLAEIAAEQIPHMVARLNAK
jgi:hypothetical protein